MFKIIPGNDKYIVSLTQEFRDLNGNVVEMPIKNGLVTIYLYGKEIKICPRWVSLIAHFEMYLPEPSLKALMNVEFCSTNITFLKTISGKQPVFKRPVTIKHNETTYRVVPAYPRYAVSCDGVVIEVSSRRQLNVIYEKKVSTEKVFLYPSVHIYTPDTSGYKYIPVHRLVAMSWVKCPNSDFVGNPIVNHKDGDKMNYRSYNLEWCSFRENADHAINTGLRQDNVKCKIRNFETGEVITFSSLGKAAEFMGVPYRLSIAHVTTNRKAKLFGDKYEVKLEKDDSPWFYETHKEKAKLGRYVIEARTSDGNTEYFFDTRDFIKRYSLWNCSGVERLLNKAKELNPSMSFSVTDNFKCGPFQVYDVKNNKVLEVETISEASRITNVPKYFIKYCLKKNETFVKQGFCFRQKTERPWNTDFVNKDEIRDKPVVAINQTTKEVKNFKSIRDAARQIGIYDRKWFSYCLYNGKEIDGWKVEILNKSNV